MINENVNDQDMRPAERAGLSHLAFIMDGNGRWAKSKGKPREYGHKHGAEAFRRVMKYGEKIGIRTLTFYAFSTENWKRPKKEVDAIIKLLDDYLDEIIKEASKAYAKFVFIGDVGVLEKRLVDKIKKIESIIVGSGTLETSKKHVISDITRVLKRNIERLQTPGFREAVIKNIKKVLV